MTSPKIHNPTNNQVQTSFCQRSAYKISLTNNTLSLGLNTKIMGIVNLTADSFSQDGLLAGQKNCPEKNSDYALKLIQEGANIIDIGGESTRPGAKPISSKEEIQRVVPTIRILAKKTKIPISIDTYKPEVAQEALNCGACLVNTIQGATISLQMIQVIRKYHAAVILMHMRQTPQTMQKKICYKKNIVQVIISRIKNSIEKCLENGIKSDKIIIDPGIGFGKTVDHNLDLIRRLNEFQVLKKPILIGTSRKSFIGNILKRNVHERIIGTIVSVCASIFNGAHIVRVHDVQKIKEAVLMADAFLGSTTYEI